MKQDNCAAPARLPRLSQVVKIDTVSVRTPRYSLAPMSLRVSSDTSATPTASAGRAIGSETRRNICQTIGAERSRGLGEFGALELEHGPRREIDVGVEHEADDDDRARHRAQIGKGGHRVAQRKPDRQRAMDQAERLEQIGIDVSRDIGRDRQRQRHQPQQQRAAGKIMQRDQPCRACADRQCQRADAEQQERGVEHRPRQHIGDQIAPQIGRRIHRQRNDREHGCCDRGRGHHRDDSCDPSGGRGTVHARPSRLDVSDVALTDLPPVSGEGDMLAETINYQSRPCPPASRPPCGWRRSSTSAGNRR